MCERCERELKGEVEDVQEENPSATVELKKHTPAQTPVIEVAEEEDERPFRVVPAAKSREEREREREERRRKREEARKPYSTRAIVSLVLSVLFGPVGLLFSLPALRRIYQKEGELRGAIFAWTAIVVSVLWTVMAGLLAYMWLLVWVAERGA